METETETEIQLAYLARKHRIAHPRGSFDSAGRWYPLLTSRGEGQRPHPAVRAPSRAWPYSYMLSCRTRKWVAGLPASTLREDARDAELAIQSGQLRRDEHGRWDLAVAQWPVYHLDGSEMPEVQRVWADSAAEAREIFARRLGRPVTEVESGEPTTPDAIRRQREWHDEATRKAKERQEAEAAHWAELERAAQAAIAEREREQREDRERAVALIGDGMGMPVTARPYRHPGVLYARGVVVTTDRGRVVTFYGQTRPTLLIQTIDGDSAPWSPLIREATAHLLAAARNVWRGKRKIIGEEPDLLVLEDDDLADTQEMSSPSLRR